MTIDTTFARDFTTKETKLIQVLVAFLFLGRAWQGLFWDLPLREFFWDQHLLEGIVTTITGDTWQNYVTNKSINSDAIISFLGKMMGSFWLLCAVLAITIKKEWKWAKWVKWLFYLGSLSLFIQALLYFKEFFMAWGQLFEYALQVTAPLFLIHIIWGGQNTNRFRWAVKIAISITFFCHGLYAYGYYPLPGTWIQWCLHIFWWLSDEGAISFLKVMGILDFVVAVLILVPFTPTMKIAIGYCIIWGTLTALARTLGNFYIHIPLQSLHEFAYETFLRLVHGGVPLLLWYCFKNSEKMPE